MAEPVNTSTVSLHAVSERVSYLFLIMQQFHRQMVRPAAHSVLPESLPW